MAQINVGEHVSGSVNVVTSNLVPSIVALIGACIPILNFFVMLNYMRGVKKFKDSGTPIEIGDLFNFDHAVNWLIGGIVYGIVVFIGMVLCVLPGMILMVLTFFFGPIMAAKPEMPWADALKTSLAFGKANIVPSLILMVVGGLIGMLGVTLPLVLAINMSAYCAHEDEILNAGKAAA